MTTNVVLDTITEYLEEELEPFIDAIGADTESVLRELFRKKDIKDLDYDSLNLLKERLSYYFFNELTPKIGYILEKLYKEVNK